MKAINALFAFLCLANLSFGQQLNIPKGKKFYYQTSNTDKTSKSNDQYTYSFQSMGKDSEGNNVLECKLLKVFSSQDGRIYLSTDSMKKSTFSSTGVFLSLAMLDKPFLVVVSPNGKLVKIEGVEQPLKVALDHWQLTPDISTSILNNGHQQMSINLQRMFFQTPEKKPLGTKEWVDKDSGFKYKLTSNAKSKIITSSRSDINSASKNKHALDLTTGLIQTAAEQYNYTSKSVRNGQDTVYIPGEVLYTQKIIAPVAASKIDREWLDMAVLFSYWSSQLKPGGNYDSLKVFDTFKSLDSRFKDDGYYRSSKLSVIQQVGRNNYKLYDSLLLETPNELLAGGSTVHFHNKLGSALHAQGVDAAYQVATYMVADQSFSQWLQHSLSQSFLNMGHYEGREKSVNDAYLLLDRFVKDKNPIFQQKAKPLYLWANAQKDPTKLLAAASEITKMNDEQSKLGHAERYALLIYKDLIKNGHQSVADTLLKTTIQKLEKNTIDPTNGNRFVAQNMLAYAWYLKYEAAAKTDSVQAITYLAKAAGYSPKDNKEKAHTSFYDRVFLQSKESYRQEYIDKLLNSGDENQAMNLIKIDINANPEKLPDMEKIYKTRFPQKDFRTFFVNEIVDSWQLAPDFRLKNIDGKEHTLDDYKNKWLVIDFWGTWCGPCKAEMPEVNKFYTEVAAGKHGDVNFLSIACNDKEEKVKSYLAQNKFSIPVVMSDEQVQYKYNVAGYPSKILISPEGKMINIQFGKDWKAILKQFQTIYSARVN